MTVALHELLRKFCHIYLDDIVIWSDSLEHHTEHVRLVLMALRDVKLYCNPKKMPFLPTGDGFPRSPHLRSGHRG